MLQSKLLDLEHSLKLLQEYKDREEQEFRDTERIESRRIDNLQSELKTLRSNLAEYNVEIKHLSTSAEGRKKLLDTKNGEIQTLKARISDSLEKNAKLASEKRSHEIELSAIQEALHTAEREVEKLSAMNQRLCDQDSEDRERIVGQGEEGERLERTIREHEGLLEQLRADIDSREKKLNATHESRKAYSRELEQIEKACGKVKEQDYDLDRRYGMLESHIKSASGKIEDLSESLMKRDKDMRNARYELTSAEDRAVESKERARKLEQEKERLEASAYQGAKERELQLNLRNEEQIRRRELEQEKKRLERELLARNVEIATGGKEFDKIKGKHKEVMEKRMDLNSEMDALSNHVKVLKTQNETVK